MCRRKGALHSGLVIALLLIAITGLMPHGAESVEMSIRPSETNLTGVWNLEFNNATLELSLCQIGGDAFGYGNLTQDDTTKEISAGGSILNDHATLYLIAVGGDRMYKMDLTVNGVMVLGGYIGHAYDGTEMSGTVSGSVVIGEYKPTEKFGHTPRKS